MIVPSAMKLSRPTGSFRKVFSENAVSMPRSAIGATPISPPYTVRTVDLPVDLWTPEWTHIPPHHTETRYSPEIQFCF